MEAVSTDEVRVGLEQRVQIDRKAQPELCSEGIDLHIQRLNFLQRRRGLKLPPCREHRHDRRNYHIDPAALSFDDHGSQSGSLSGGGSPEVVYPFQEQQHFGFSCFQDQRQTPGSFARIFPTLALVHNQDLLRRIPLEEHLLQFERVRIKRCQHDERCQ